MSEFVHSESLFWNNDGIPLEFNIQYVKNKTSTKSLIEHGGGICTLKDDAIHIVSPGTTVVNVNSEIKLVSTSFIHDCVKQNCLLDIDEYTFVINEMETSDISDNSQNLIEDLGEHKDNIENSTVDNINSKINPSPNTQAFPNSNHDFDFQDSENTDNLITKKEDNPVIPLQPADIRSKHERNILEKACDEVSSNVNHNENDNPVISLQPADINSKPETNIIQKVCSAISSNVNHNKEKDNSATSLQPVDIHSKPETNVLEKACNEICLNNYLEDHNACVNNEERETREVLGVSENNQISNDNNKEAVKLNDQDTSINAEIVSSSQPEDGGVLDLFDKMVLKKAENPAEEDDNALSQSYTVSSSNDAQISPKAPSNMSGELFNGSDYVPDSASQTTKRQQYINDLEKEIEQIMQKPSPKSIQDKITFIKYICTVKKLPPAIVLQTLQNF